MRPIGVLGPIGRMEQRALLLLLHPRSTALQVAGATQPIWKRCSDVQWMLCVSIVAVCGDSESKLYFISEMPCESRMLGKFPGPRSAAWSNVLYCYYYIQGRQPFKLLELHNCSSNSRARCSMRPIGVLGTCTVDVVCVYSSSMR
jgi:hypothetical protein